MKYEDAKEAIIKSEDYASADFYRMRNAKSIALGLKDEPELILMDILLHGSADSKNLLQTAMEEGYVIQHETEEGVPLLAICDTENIAGAPYNFMSHVAMQIAYPALYWEYYEGEHVWTYSHSKMQELLKLCFSCLSDNRHPSDYYGQHTFSEDEDDTKKQKVKIPNNAHKNWVRACQDRKKEISSAWSGYIELCTKRKESIANWAKWREEQLEPLMQQIDAVNEQHDKAIDELSKGINDAFRRHADLKASNKPQIIEYK